MNSDLLSQLSLEEKAKLMSGQDLWSTYPVPRLGIPSIYMSDGPHGLRKVDPQVALGASVPATCFPTASAMASSWNPDLIQKAGIAIGLECLMHDVQILLGPGTNIKRSPLGGRNFEYFSEDPLLSGIMASALIRGLQSQGIGACVKHFTANNQEFERMVGSSELDEQTFREIYLTAFEIIVKESHPYAIMCAYNQINGVWASESRELLYKILREEWGYEGMVVSDWGAINHPEKAIAAGVNLEMPDNPLSPPRIMEAVQNNALAEEDLDERVGELLNIVFKAHENRKKNITVDFSSHHELSRQIAAESIVLLKNEEGLLPLGPKKLSRVAIIGKFAKQPRFQGSGSSRVNAHRIDTPYEALEKALPPATRITYSDGYTEEADQVHKKVLLEACEIASASEVAILFVGLPDEFEAEGSDRSHMKLPLSHSRLIREVLKVQARTVVVLLNGSAIEMHPWISDSKTVLEAWLAGQACGSAIADVLLGKTNPSGKLSESFPLKLEHNPSYLNFPGQNRKVHYREGIFVGYRYYDTKELDVLFPFGHGLSYTDFEYSNLAFSEEVLSMEDTCRMSFFLKNAGPYPGQEVVQVYISPPDSLPNRPAQELAAFDKISLDSGSIALVEFILEKRAFSYYDIEKKSWQIAPGTYTIHVGSSSRDIRLSKTISIEPSSEHQLKKYDKFSTVAEILEHPMGKAYVDEMMKLFGVDPHVERKEDMDMRIILQSMPIVKRCNFSKGAYTEEMLREFLNQVNGA